MIVLTFDTDYLSPEDLERFHERFPFPGQGTYFLWKPFHSVRLPRQEIGLHPYLEQTERWSETMTRFIDELGYRPATVRPHSCVYSHFFGTELVKFGFESISQATYLYQTGLSAYRHPWGLWELPIYYMESMDFTYQHNWPKLGHQPFDSAVIDRSLTHPGLYVYDFHPLHVILNTSSYPQYQSVRAELVERGKSPFDLGFSGRGARTFFLELVEKMQRAGVESVTCSQAVSAAARSTEASRPASVPPLHWTGSASLTDREERTC